MEANKKKIYYIPPNLHRTYQMGGFTIMELIVFLTIAFGAGYLAMRHGLRFTLAVPALLLVLHCRVLPDGKNAREYLAMRWRYFKKEQAYSLQECEPKR